VRRPPKPRGVAHFDFPDPEEPGLGVAAGIQSSQLRRLRGGKIAVERRVDLHGLRAAEARSELVAELCAALDRRERCVLVVHGKGLRSKETPVLRRSLPEWLADPRLEGRVLAFAPAQPADGGNGATYVLLRRRRE
jgi:DNA-nicking Smr family endonuclease